MWQFKKYSWHFSLSLFTLIILGSFIARGYTFPVGNHYTHVPQIKSMLNPELYTNDYYVQEMLQFTPRYYYQYLVYFFSKVTGNISLTYLIYYLISFISFIWGLSAISKIFTPSKLSAAVLIFLSLTSYTLIGYLKLFPNTPIPATFAMSLTVWGFYFCFRQKWIIAYFFFGIASILQFLVGVLPGIMMIPIMLIEAIKYRNLKQFNFWGEVNPFGEVKSQKLKVKSITQLIPIMLVEAMKNQKVKQVKCFGKVNPFGEVKSQNFQVKSITKLMNCLLRDKSIFLVILPLIILFGLACLVYLPMVLTGTTSTNKLINEEFVFIYGWVRNPHHIISAYWNWKSRLDFICFFLGGCLCIHKINIPKSEDLQQSRTEKNFDHRYPFPEVEIGKIKEKKVREKDLSLTDVRCLEKWKFYLIIAESIFALFLGYIFVEVYPLALFAKLQLARTVPFAQLMIFIVVGVLVNQLYQQENLGVGLLLIISLILPVPYQGICFFILSLGLFFLERWNYKLIVFLMLLGGLIFYLLHPPIDLIVNRLFVMPGLFFVLVFPFILDEVDVGISLKKLMTYSLAIATSLVFVLGLFEALPGKILEVFEQQVKFNRVPQDEVTKLALRFREISHKDDVILIPPFVSNFQFFSERAVIVDFKHFPQTDRGIKEWKNRMEDVFGVPLSDKLAVGAMEILFPQQTGKELVNVAKKYGAEYILTRVDWHGDIKGKVLDQEGEWAIFQINSDE
ncbi:MAG: hypothetical protein F6K40_09915 [Okeania sp. SIO3I5]|uniref:DUF6798 domain-containing protein n=1 Tax=Okeania sp. SIO3I5 TaxID=2607805 RepID=UPI0013BD2376|nr:DUF6798 domain-containing protein [Okeania sp. SIO3I5]NEQ36573.1 hypothetical protein [Okeania sp. SIO3I5]